MALTPHQEITTIKQVRAIMQAPQGRDFGRAFLEELGKGEKGDVGRAINDRLDVFAKVLRELYGGEPPVQSR